MAAVSTIRHVESDTGIGLFERIGAFLSAHGLSPEPAHYSFAYHVLSEPDGALARAVAAITDGGIRLSRHDIEALGGEVSAGAPVTFELAATSGESRQEADPAVAAADAMLARAQLQVEDFADTVRTMHDEASDFGRDLAASAAALAGDRLGAGIDEIARLTGAMLERVRQSEVRLESATRETDALRLELDEARGNARQDPLTELANRRAFDEAYAALPDDAPAVVAICDIDHFKRINDEFGHAVGDRVLKSISQTLAYECGDHLVVRYGGEEFAILFTETPLDEAIAVVERARDAVAARRFRSRATDALIGEITMSAGVAFVPAGERQARSLARADAALYDAKRAGRNRVACAPDCGV